MPVYSFSVHSSTGFYLLWKIEESVEGLYPQLPPQFLTDFHSLNLSHKDKIRQSLSVRIALYCLLKKLDFPIFTLSKNRQGRPVLDGSRLHISFTHTRYVAGAALSTSCPIGIDLEMVQSNLHMIQARFLTEEEVKDINNSFEKLAIYWSAKEALYKRLDKQHLSTFKDMRIAPFQLQIKGKMTVHLHQKKYAMDYQRIEDPALQPHVLVCCEN